MPRRSITVGSRVRIAEGRSSGVVGVVMPASVLHRRPTKSEVVVAQDGTGRLYTTFRSVLEPMPPLHGARHGDWGEPARPLPRVVTEPRRDAQGLMYTFNFFGGPSADQLAQRLRGSGVEATADRDRYVRGALRARDWPDAASRINRTVNARVIQTEFNLRATGPQH